MQFSYILTILWAILLATFLSLGNVWVGHLVPDSPWRPRIIASLFPILATLFSFISNTLFIATVSLFLVIDLVRNFVTYNKNKQFYPMLSAYGVMPPLHWYEKLLIRLRLFTPAVQAMTKHDSKAVHWPVLLFALCFL